MLSHYSEELLYAPVDAADGKSGRADFAMILYTPYTFPLSASPAPPPTFWASALDDPICPPEQTNELWSEARHAS